jgi:RNA polymerase sigma factor (sigma-70 family)
MIEDPELLHRFIEQNSETAFRELVQRRIDFVYAAALRQVGGDAHLAQEVAQNVFLDLARKARGLARRPNILGWLYTSTRFAAAKALRSRARRSQHETEAHAMNEILADDAAAGLKWTDLRPVLDEIMHELGETDREAILLRFFQAYPLAEVGVTLGLSENSARMRVDRALEKLRVRLERRGITSTAAALAIALSHQPAIAVPVGLAATVAGFSLAGAATAGGGIAAALCVLELMNMTKLTIGIVGAIAGVGLGAFLGIRYETGTAAVPDVSRAKEPSSVFASLRAENQQLTDEIAKLHAERAVPRASRTAVNASGSETKSSLDELRLIAALQEKKLVRSSITFVGQGGSLEPAFVELFALTPAEQTALRQAIDNACERLRELEQPNTTVTRSEKGDVVVTTKPFPKAGGQLYDELVNSFAHVLGPERYAAYATLGAAQVENALGGFGAVERVVTFSYDPNAKSPYSMREDRSSPGSHSNSSSSFGNIEELSKRADTVMRFVPPDFGAKK